MKYKFRGKNIFNEHWHYGSLLEINKKSFICWVSDDGLEEVEVERDSVGQKVEILGKEIYGVYEGDLVRISNVSVGERNKVYEGVIYLHRGYFCLIKESSFFKEVKEFVVFCEWDKKEMYGLEYVSDGICEVKVLKNVNEL